MAWIVLAENTSCTSGPVKRQDIGSCQLYIRPYEGHDATSIRSVYGTYITHYALDPLPDPLRQHICLMVLILIVIAMK